MKKIKILPHENKIITASSIIDGTGSAALHNAAVILLSGIIKDIRSHYTTDDLEIFLNTFLDKNRDKNFEVLRFPHLTLLPGFIDCHIHLALDGVDFQQAVDQWNDEKAVFERIKRELENYLQCGVLAVRDGSDKNNYGLKARNRVLAGAMEGPKIIATGQAVYKKGKYGSFLGPGAGDPEALTRAVHEQARNGVNQIKVVVSGIVSFKEFGRVGPVQFAPENLSLVVKEAHSLGLKVMAHASSHEAVKVAVNAGVLSVEHGYFVKPEIFPFMAQKGTAWIPTGAPFANLLRGKSIKKLTSQELDVIKRTYEQHLIRINEAFKEGVLVGIGTDAGAPGVAHGYSFYDEIMVYREAGISEKDILKAATVKGAKILGLEKEFGTIQKGKPANFIGVRGNPLEDLSVLKNIELISYFVPQPKTLT